MNNYDFLGTQAKQHINLQEHEWAIIYDDIYEFNSPGLSFFINRIIKEFISNELFPANISKNIELKKKELKTELAKLKCSASVKNDFFKIYTDDYINTIKERYQSPKGLGQKFDVNMECRSLLSQIGENSYEQSVFPQRGQYIRAILKEYVSYKNAMREEIYFHDKTETINKAIRNNYSVRITSEVQSESLFPYKLIHDKSDFHSYLICLSKIQGQEIKTRSFRLTRIKKIVLENTIDSCITDTDKQFIETELFEKEVSYLSSPTDIIKVRLTPKGQKMYNQLSFLRPRHLVQTDKEKVAGIFTFNCTIQQVSAYFKKFCGEAEIISPLSLRDSFRDEYRKALETYQ